MIYGKLTGEDWRTIHVEGDAPESVYQDDELRLFFWGTLYNRDVLVKGDASVSNACLVAGLFQSGYQTGALAPVQALAALDGCFTWVYFTRTSSGIVRDAHGTHWPVYYRADGTFSTSLSYFSESGQKLMPDRASLSAALQRGLILSGRSVWTGVSRLEAGCHLCFTGGSFTCSSLYAQSSFVSPTLPSDKPELSDYVHGYRELHQQAIRRRIGSYSHVGILLSGGYDSGSNLAALRSVYSGPIDSYSIGFKGDTWTELPLARLMSKEFGTCHHEYEIDGSEIRFLPEIIRFWGEPFVEGGLMVNYCAMRLVGEQKPEVVLGGDGNDQYFGTSSREVALYYGASRMQILPLMRMANRFLQNGMGEKSDKFYRIHFHLDKILHLLEGERFGFSDGALRRLLQHPAEDGPRYASPIPDVSSFDNLYNQHAWLSDVEIVINRLILYKASSMARLFGVNLVFPFMDRSLYDFLGSLPVGWKCQSKSVWDMARGRAQSKYLLKLAYKPLLPAAVTERKKQGGFAPMPLFFADAHQRTHLKEFILSSSIFDTYLSREAVLRFLNHYDRQVANNGGWFWYRQNLALQYFNLLAVVTWWEEFVAEKRVEY